MIKDPLLTYWYLEPLNQDSNETLARMLPEEDACTGVMCSDGKQRNLWRTNHQVVQKFDTESPTRSFRFRVFVRTGKYGQVRPWLFGRKRLKRKKKEERVMSF